MEKLRGSLFGQSFTKGSGTTKEDLIRCGSRYRKFRVVKQGWMWKQGKIVTSWKRRYFAMILPGVLFYFEDEQKCEALASAPYQVHRDAEMAAPLVIASIPCDDTTVVAKIGAHEGKEFVFSVQVGPPTNRKFILACESEAEMSDWIRIAQDMKSVEENEAAAHEQKRRAEMIEKYQTLLPLYKDPFTGGIIRCGKEVWSYVSGGAGDRFPAVLEALEGRFAGVRYNWNGTAASGMLALLGDAENGWALWDGLKLQWRGPRRVSRGHGQAWEYTCDPAHPSTFTANKFTSQVGFPFQWTITSEELPSPLVLSPRRQASKIISSLEPAAVPPDSSGPTAASVDPAKAESAAQFRHTYSAVAVENKMPILVENIVVVEGSVPPVVALCCAMYCGTRKELEYQEKMFQEYLAEQRSIKAADLQNLAMKEKVLKRIRATGCGHAGPAARFCPDCQDGYCEACDFMSGRCPTCGKGDLETLSL